MRNVTRLLPFVIPLGLVLAYPAMGEALCGDRDKMLAALKKEYDEHVVALGVTKRDAVMERLESRDGSTWTIIVTTPNGRTCFVAAGDFWQSVPLPVKRGEPS